MPDRLTMKCDDCRRGHTQAAKRCTSCGTTKLLDEFGPNRTHSDGRASQCRRCVQAFQRAHAARPEVKARMAAYQAQYRATEKNRLREAVLSRYGAACCCCGEATPAFLTLDHIDGRAAWGHKRSMCGATLHRWLERRGWPDGFQTLCWNCNWAKGAYGVCPHRIATEVVG